MPYVLAFNRKAIEDKIKRLAAYIGLRPSFRAFMDFVLELREQTGIPHTLAGLKVGDDKVDTIVKMAPEGPDRRRQSGEARPPRRAHDLHARAGGAGVAMPSISACEPVRRRSASAMTGYSADTSFSPTIPATISPMQASRSALADSPNSTMPSSAVPIVPMPVQIA